jgi:hypothetical protein
MSSGKKYLISAITLTLAVFGALGLTFKASSFSDIFTVNISLEKNQDVGPKEAIIINFSQPVNPLSFNGKIAIVPKINAQLSWSTDSRKLTITPNRLWKPEKRYAVSLGIGKSKRFAKTDPVTFNFSTEPFPKVSGFTPAAGAKDVILDIEDPIVVDFTKSTKDFFIKYDFNPSAEVAYQFNLEKTQFQLLPKAPIKEGQKYEVSISAKYVNDSDENYKEIYTSTFETLPPKNVVWDRNFSVRIDQAKQYTRPQIAGGKYIDINLKAQVLSIFENGKLLDSFMISTGKRGMETPKGTWAISNKTPRAWSKAYGLFMPFWMALLPSGKFGIHELPEWPGGYKEGAAHLGTPVSHGCVRLGIGPAERVYGWADMGTPVVVY